MSLLNLRPEEPSKKPSINRVTKLLGTASLLGAVALGSTFAANISLNGDQNVEFGQGVAVTTACDDEISITPHSTFVNETGGGEHKLTSIEVSGIDSSSEACSGKTFTIRAYGDAGQLDLFRKQYINGDNPPVYLNHEDYDTVEISDVDGVFSWVSGGTDGDDVTTPPDEEIHNTSFTIGFSSATQFLRLPLAAARDVKRITVETTGDSDSYISTVATVNVDATSASDDFFGSDWVNHGTGSNLSLLGSPTHTTGVTGDGGGNLEFNSSGSSPWQYATGSYAVNSSQLHRVTVELWMKLESESGNAFPMLFVTGSTAQYDIARINNRIGFNTWTEELYGFDASSYMGSWHHYVFVMSDGPRASQKLYIDGVRKELTSNGIENPSNRNFPTNGIFSAFYNVGQDGWPAHAFVGGMRIYPGELPLASIQSNYNSYDRRL